MSENLCCVSLCSDARHDALDVGVFQIGDELVLLLVGEADCATASSLEQALATATENDGAVMVTLDVAGLSFLSAECLGLICGAESRLRGQARRLVVRAPSRLVRRELEICGLGSTIATTVRVAQPDAA